MTEQRICERISCRFRMFYHVGPVPTWWWGTVADVSPRGLRLKTYRPLDRGIMLEIDLALPELRPARVVHTEPEEAAGYQVGCTFLQELSRSEFEELQRQAAAQGEAWKHSE